MNCDHTLNIFKTNLSLFLSVLYARSGYLLLGKYSFSIDFRAFFVVYLRDKSILKFVCYSCVLALSLLVGFYF